MTVDRNIIRFAEPFYGSIDSDGDAAFLNLSRMVTFNAIAMERGEHSVRLVLHSTDEMDARDVIALPLPNDPSVLRAIARSLDRFAESCEGPASRTSGDAAS